MISDYKDTIDTIYTIALKLWLLRVAWWLAEECWDYLERYIELPETTEVIVGYQAEGTRVEESS
jgi:metallo-beta-lactamase family protein